MPGPHAGPVTARYPTGQTPGYLRQVLLPTAVAFSPFTPASDQGAAPQGPVTIQAEQVLSRSLAPLQPWFNLDPTALLACSGRLSLQFQWPRGEEDSRELSEIPELRIWSLRADALCPWLPLLLERGSGDLGRHVAMLLPHGFSASDGIRFAEGSLELWVSHRLFLLDAWARAAGLNCRGGLGQMAAVLGLELDPAFWDKLPL